jgi:hypothetical protein
MRAPVLHIFALVRVDERTPSTMLTEYGRYLNMVSSIRVSRDAGFNRGGLA